MGGAHITSKDKLMELDLVRAFCIIAVVLIHGTSFATVELDKNSWLWLFYYVLNKASTFTVPVFLFISALVLTYQYTERWSRSLVPVFYQKRIKVVLIPYLIWSVVYYIAPQFYSTPFVFTVRLGELVKLMQWAQTSYHLYFLLIVLQLYMIFPLIMAALQRFKPSGPVLVAIGVLIQGLYYWNEAYNHPFGHRATICLNYMAVLAFGAAAGLYYSVFRDWVSRRTLVLTGLSLAAGGWFVGMFLVTIWFKVKIVNLWFELAFVAYAIAMAALLVGISVRWCSREEKGWLFGLLRKVGQASFGIYLLHPLWLTFWRMKVRLPNWEGMYHMYILGGTVWCFLGAWLLVGLYRRLSSPTNRARWFNGIGTKRTLAEGTNLQA